MKILNGFRTLVLIGFLSVGLMFGQVVNPPQPAQPMYNINALSPAAFYQTQEAYTKATGKPAPAYDLNQPIKKWVDPDAVAALSNGGDSQDFEIYNVVGSDLKLHQRAGSLSFLASVNIPPTVTGTQVGVPVNKKGEVDFPVRALLPNEFIKNLPLGGAVVIRSDLLPGGGVDTGFTDADRSLLKAIAGKLGVN